MGVEQVNDLSRVGSPKKGGAIAQESVAAATLSEWSALVQRLELRLHLYFRRLPASSEERHDLARNVLASVYVAAREGPPDTDLAAVIEAVAREEGAVYMRHHRHEVQLDDRTHSCPTEWPHPDRRATREAAWRWLEPLLAGLSDVQRLVIERGLDHVTDAQIAEEIGYQPDSIRSLRHRAMKKLRVLARASPPPPES